MICAVTLSFCSGGRCCHRNCQIGCAVSELLYADDVVLMSETIEGLNIRFLEWKEAIESKGLKVDLGKRQWSAAVPQRMACLIEKLVHVGLLLESKG